MSYIQDNKQEVVNELREAIKSVDFILENKNEKAAKQWQINIKYYLGFLYGKESIEVRRFVGLPLGMIIDVEGNIHRTSHTIFDDLERQRKELVDHLKSLEYLD